MSKAVILRSLGRHFQQQFAKLAFCCGPIICYVFTTKTLAGAVRGCSLRASSGALAALWSLTWQFCAFNGAPEPPRGAIWCPRVPQSLHNGAPKAPQSCHDAPKMLPKSSPWDHRASKWDPMALEAPPWTEKGQGIPDFVKICCESLTLTGVT